MPVPTSSTCAAGASDSARRTRRPARPTLRSCGTQHSVSVCAPLCKRSEKRTRNGGDGGVQAQWASRTFGMRLFRTPVEVAHHRGQKEAEARHAEAWDAAGVATECLASRWRLSRALCCACAPRTDAPTLRDTVKSIWAAASGMRLKHSTEPWDQARPATAARRTSAGPRWTCKGVFPPRRTPARSCP